MGFAGRNGQGSGEGLQARLERCLDSLGPGALATLMGRVFDTGKEWTYYPPDPLAQQIQMALAEFAVAPDSTLRGVDHLAALPSGCVLLSNHLSYADANLLSVLLMRHGHAQIANRLTVIAGPKVYSDPLRRFSSLCFGTIKTPQSSARSSEDAVMTAREVAKVALETIALSRERLALGDALVIFVEGTRSRTGGMQRALPAITRYFDPPGVPLVPMGITGSEKFLPVGDQQFHVTTIHVRIGRPADAGTLLELSGGNRRLAMDAVGIAISRLLPHSYNGTYGEDSEELAPAREIADRVFAKD